MDASAANKFMIFLLFSLSILLIVNGGTSSFKQHIKPKHEHSERKLDSTTTTPAVFNPVTTIPGGTNPVIPPPSIVTIPSAPTVYNPVTTNPVVPAGSMTNYPAPLPPAVAGQSWCVVKGGATETALQAALDYACGIGGADCSALQVGASCYYPNTLENHASFAFNSYYQRNPVQTSCDFGGTALITNVNPSSGSCIYTPSTTIPSPATTGVAPPITTNPTTTPTPTTTGVSPITTNPTTGVSPITTNPTPTPTADSGIIPISFGTPPMVSSGGNPALGGGATMAVRLERQGVWRTWLGSDALYRTFVPFLSSQASWDAFMTQQHHNTNNNKNVVDDDSSNSNKLILQLQLRARALLFDKASLSLYPRTLSSSNSILNPNYLELHVDDVYFTLESATQDGDQCITAGKPLSSKGPPIKSGALNSRQCGSEANALSQRFKSEEFPETWYSQFFEKSGASKSYRLMFGDRESEKRTPEQMSAYLRVAENHKRRRVAFHENVANVRSNDGSAVDDTPLFPETMYILNCVPDSAVPQTSRKSTNHRIPFNGVLDNLPQLSIKSPAINPIMIERLGIRPEYLNMERGLQTRGRNGYEGNRKLLGQEQASEMSQKIVARLLMNMGFDSSLDSSLEVLAQLLSCHISKLGRILKLVADSYRKQCSATELLKLFLRAAGQSNLGSLMEILKDNTKNVQQQNQQQMVGIQFQAQLQQLQQQNPIQQTPQMLRQMSPHMQQLNNPQYLAFQQQMHWERMRKRQQSTPRPGVAITEIIDRPRPPLVQVKMENPSSDFPMETNAFMGMNSRQAQAQVQLQQQQQQLVARSSLHAQQAIANSNALRPVGSPQIPQIQSPSMSMGRAPPVKVEGFQELMGSGDSSMKHDSEENKLTSPQK